MDVGNYINNINMIVKKWEILVTTVSGRDKVFRSLQVFLRFLSWFTQYYTENYHKYISSNNTHLTYILYISQQLNNFGGGFAAGRRFFRLGHLPSFTKGLIESMLYETDSVLRWTQIIGKIASILALLVDHLGWFARQGTIKNWSYDIESTMSCFFGLISIIMGLWADYHSLNKVRQRIKSYNQNQSNQNTMNNQSELECNYRMEYLLERRRFLLFALFRNIMDFPPTLNGLTKYTTSGAWNFFGTVSSFTSLYQAWPTKLKS